jgi:ABC-type branched-subunit amino acid transport system substrate-binding protein
MATSTQLRVKELLREEGWTTKVLAEKTGGLAAYGYSHEKVMRAAVEKVNKAGGIGGRPVGVICRRHGVQTNGRGAEI